MSKERLARDISFILGPQVWFPVLLLLFFFKTGLTQQQIFILAPLLILFQIIIPFVVLYWLIKTKKVSDWDIRKREERYQVLPIFVLSTFAGLFSVYYVGTILFFNLFLTLWLTAFVGVVITYKWKISLHLILNTAAVILVNFLFHWQLPFLYFLIPLVAWARYTNKHHTILQLVGGIVVSATIVLLSFKYLLYI